MLKRSNRSKRSKGSKGSKKVKRQGGGGLGGGWGFTAAPFGGTVNNALAWTSNGHCRMTDQRPGFLTSGYTGPKSLPGMSGMSGGATRKNRRGYRKNSRKNSRKGYRKNRKQAGGRYGFGGADGTVIGPPWGAGLASTAHVPCEASRSPIPPSGADGTLNKIGSYLWDGPKGPIGQMGGAALNLSPASLGEAAGSPSLTEQTAGYTHLRSGADTFPTAAGTLSMVNAPAAGRFMNPACLKTGGRRRNGKNKSRKNGRKGKKSKKNSRRN
jgi:hypothetical protein